MRSENDQTSPSFHVTLLAMEKFDLTDDACFEALRTRDARFDGKFFFGVKTTGIYCRPICPAKPKRENVHFFPTARTAEKAGFRACLRCRPESAPESALWLGTSAVVRRAMRVLAEAVPGAFDEDRFALQFGVTARHLRRLFRREIGSTPKQIWRETRLQLARKLLTESRLPVSQVAFAAGYDSIRRFNGAFRKRFAQKPTEVRQGVAKKEKGLRVSLAYRPPFDFRGLYEFYERHRVGLLEGFSGGIMTRAVKIGEKSGSIAIENDEAHSRLWVTVDFPDLRYLPQILARVRALFDLDSDPRLLAEAFSVTPEIAVLLKQHPGLRLPSGWDPFEIAIGNILGQLVSVDRARQLVAEVIRRYGEKLEGVTFFPSPERLANADFSTFPTTGVRKQTLRDFARAVANGELSLEETQEVEPFIEKVRTIRGIGPWTAHAMAMRVLRSTDAFPESDLILARALELHPRAGVDRLSPWRGYVAMLFWKEYAVSLGRKRK